MTKKRTNKFLAIILAFLLVLSTLPTSAFADDSDGSQSVRGKISLSIHDDAPTLDVSILEGMLLEATYHGGLKLIITLARIMGTAKVLLLVV